MEQGLALARRWLPRRPWSSSLQVAVGPGLGRQQAGGGLGRSRVARSTGVSGRRQIAHQSAASSTAWPGCARTACQKRLVDAAEAERAQARRRRASNGQVMHDVGVELGELLRRRSWAARATEAAEVEAGDEVVAGRRPARPDRRCRAAPAGVDRHRLDALARAAAPIDRRRGASTARRRRHRPAAADGRRRASTRRAPRRSRSAPPVLVTWSSPRMTWVMPSSMSSTTDGSV